LPKFKGGIDREGGAAGGKMLRTLFSRMLAAYLSVIIIVLIALGFMASSIFHDHYIEKIKSELVREADAICRIVLEEYMDDAKRPVAKEKLFAIVRQYEALLQLCFIDPSLGIRSFYDEKNASKWQASEEFDVETLAKNIVSQTNFEYGYAYDLLDGYTTVRTLTVTCPISTAENITVGALMLHYDMDGIYASLNKLYIDVFAAVAGAVLITIPIAFIISKYITKPVSQINDAVTAFSRGNYDSRVKVGRMDELGELGISFNDMADKVSELEKMRRDFVANVSHELRSPLSSIRGFLEAMEDGTIPTDEHEKYIEIVLDETRRMSGMVNDLLDIARIESGQYKLNLSVFDINDLIGRVLITFEARITAKHADVDAQLDYEPVFVEADRDRIGQVLHNLIDNAIKFMPENYGLLTIKSVVSKHKVYVSICDNGPGIPKEDIAHIFDRFYKAEKAHTYKNGSGTGLGLSIVKLVIDQHHGEIKAESSENGTVFTFSLKQALPPPRRQPAAE